MKWSLGSEVIEVQTVKLLAQWRCQKSSPCQWNADLCAIHATLLVVELAIHRKHRDVTTGHWADHVGHHLGVVDVGGVAVGR